ncbi:kinase-like domain-containing protein [Baffinella frigidus]|nr:kinase-like domain-containing protein [Cryptophyta sp. CCMP2293]
MLSIVPTEEPAYFNLSDSGSFREGLLHISQGGTTVHSSRSALSNEPSTTSAKRANYQEEVRFELNRGDFENMEIIGKGSSGFVRKALRKSTNEILALKVVNVFEEEKRKQMMQEVVMMCDAQSLIRFHGAFYNEGTIAIALEYMTGGSVSDVVKLSGGVPERIMAYMAEQIVQGIAFMHSRKQVHRDFKPCNLLLDHSGRVKITDFGVSAELDRSIDNCTTFVGTFLYMSPERFGSEPYSFPSDIWSFGLTMIECATGEYPYLKGTSKAYWELMEHIVKSEAPTLPADGDFSPKFRSFVSSCLPKEASARATATKLLHHPFIEEHCSSETPEDKQAAIAEWLGSVRSCFVSGNLPNAPNFQPADVGSNFVSFYLAYFLATRRKSLWSLYDHASVLTIGDEEVPPLSPRQPSRAPLPPLSLSPARARGRQAGRQAGTQAHR